MRFLAVYSVLVRCIMKQKKKSRAQTLLLWFCFVRERREEKVVKRRLSFRVDQEGVLDPLR
jgi:hypothetical protein